MTKKRYLLWLPLIACLWGATVQLIYADNGVPCPQNTLRYVYSWSIDSHCGSEPRGGSSKGVAVRFDTQPHATWLAIQEGEISSHEQDRRAILAMAGPYKVSFDFLETMGFIDGFKRDKPYQSWGTEYVYVVENRKNFISLQHVMVMYFERDDGSSPEPMVMKHWRQDWTYQDDELLVYVQGKQWLQPHRAAVLASGNQSLNAFVCEAI